MGLDCRKCSHCLEIPTRETNEYAESFGLKGYDAFCKHPDLDKTYDKNGNIEHHLIQGSRYTDYAVLPPAWCPMTNKLNNLPVQGESQNKTNMESNKHRKTYTETCAMIKKVKPITDIKDIEIGQVYHCPPFREEKRFDLYVIRKNEWHIFGRVVLDDGVTLGDPKYLYLTTDAKIKFLVKNKISKFDIAKIKEKAKIMNI